MVARSLVQRTTRGVVGVSTLLSRGLGARPPVNDRGVELDPQCHGLLALEGFVSKPLDAYGAERGREEMRRKTWIADVPFEVLHRVEDRSIDGPRGPIPIRIYTPRPARGSEPAIVFFHGGGFVVGDLESHDRICRHFARAVDATVIAVDYRLAPEHPLPEGVEDCAAAFRWVYANAPDLGIDAARVAVAGDSAGGNLAAVTCQLMRDEGHPLPCFQLLIYPGTDLTRSARSHETFARGFFLERSTIDWFVAQYVTDPADEIDPRGSPLRAESFEGLPRAHVAVAGFDPLRDEGEAYAAKLQAASVPTTVRCYGSLVHGFFNMGGICTAARFAVADLAEVTRNALHDVVGS